MNKVITIVAITDNDLASQLDYLQGRIISVMKISMDKYQVVYEQR